VKETHPTHHSLAKMTVAEKWETLTVSEKVIRDNYSSIIGFLIPIEKSEN
jgi:hypothetical protein